MKCVIVLAVLAIATQAYSQCIPSCAAPVYANNCGCGCPAPAIVAAPAPALVAASAPALVAAPAVVATNNVAANLADTLSLLTVTTLLAETLPYGCPAAYAPAPVAYPGCAGYGYLL